MMKSTNVIYRDAHVKQIIVLDILLYPASLNGQNKVLPNIVPMYLVPSKPLPVTKEVRELL